MESPPSARMPSSSAAISWPRACRRSTSRRRLRSRRQAAEQTVDGPGARLPHRRSIAASLPQACARLLASSNSAHTRTFSRRPPNSWAGAERASGHRVGSIDEPSFQAGRSVAERRCLPVAQSSATRARHPHAPFLDAAIHLAAAPMLLKEGIEGIPETPHSSDSLTEPP
jgi:hypothetical protein